jgi:hypothetical protein
MWLRKSDLLNRSDTAQVDGGQENSEDCSVVRASRPGAAAVATVVLLAGLTNVVTLAREAACCAKTDYTCAGMQTPDDCCRSMGHTAGLAPAATTNASAPVVVPATAQPLIAAPTATVRVCAPFEELVTIRPHDPPHLHTFALLI